jgi:hypothetical protein
MGVLPSHKQLFFIVQFTACFGPDTPSSGDLDDTQLVIDYIEHS